MAESPLFYDPHPENLDPLFMSIKDFAVFIGRSEVTVSRLIRQGIIVPLRDGRRVTIPVEDAVRRYVDYLRDREQNAQLRTETAPPSAPKISSPLADRAFAMGDFVVKDTPRTTDPEPSPETPQG